MIRFVKMFSVRVIASSGPAIIARFVRMNFTMLLMKIGDRLLC